MNWRALAILLGIALGIKRSIQLDAGVKYLIYIVSGVQRHEILAF
jgi:hypothetical protein